ncbi:MAG: hypothetical protein WCS52_03110 [bacterium]
MSDIIVTCAQCGNNITISEYVTAEVITCIKCKAQVPIPVRTPDLTTATSKLKIALPKAPEPPPATALPPPVKLSRKAAQAAAKKNVQQYLPQGGKKRIRARKISTFEIKVLPWLVFVGLLLAFGWMRHVPGALAPDIHPQFIQGGVWALLLLHVSVICLAFGDDAFSGILCFIIPGYTIYYLFTQADQILLRALVAALLIVFGWDFVIAAGAFWNEVYATVSTWIATTDTIKKK